MPKSFLLIAQSSRIGEWKHEFTSPSEEMAVKSTTKLLGILPKDMLDRFDTLTLFRTDFRGGPSKVKEFKVNEGAREIETV